MSSIGPSPPALPCRGCRSLSPGAAPGWRMLEAGRSRMALHPEIDAALRKEDEERGRAEGELFSQGRAKKWKSLWDRHSPHSVLGHSQALQGITQAETAPGLPLQLQFKVAEGNPRGAA